MTTPPPADHAQPSLVRALGPGIATAIVVGNVIGSGIFVKPGAIAQHAGSVPLIMTAWLVGGLLCLMAALSVAELSVAIPRAGGPYVYLKAAYGRPVAFLFGWTAFLFSIPASIGALSVIFVGALASVFGLALGPLGQLGGSISVILLMSFINSAGVIWGGRMQGLTTIFKAGFVALIAFLPFVLPLFGYESQVDFARFTGTTSDADTTPLSARFAVILLAVMWAYDGWEGVTPVAEEIRDPHRNLPIALFGGIGILMVLYLSANVAYHAVLPLGTLAKAGPAGAETMVKSLLGSSGGKLMSAGLMLSTFGAINSNILLGSRISFAMGRDGVFFRGLGRVHATYRTPVIAILVLASMSGLLVASATLLVRFGYTKSEMTVFDLLTNYVVFAAGFFYMLSVLAVIILRIRRPDLPRPYRTLGYPVVPLAYVLFYVWFLSNVYRDQPLAANIGVGLIALGLPVYYAWRKFAPRDPDSPMQVSSQM